MLLYIDCVIEKVRSKIPILSCGDRSLDEILSRYSYDVDGISGLSNLDHLVSQRIVEVLRTEFPGLNAQARDIFCDLQMSHLRDKIRDITNSYICYCALIARRANLVSATL